MNQFKAEMKAEAEAMTLNAADRSSDAYTMAKEAHDRAKKEYTKAEALQELALAEMKRLSAAPGAFRTRFSRVFERVAACGHAHLSADFDRFVFLSLQTNDDHITNLVKCGRVDH